MAIREDTKQKNRHKRSGRLKNGAAAARYDRMPGDGAEQTREYARLRREKRRKQAQRKRRRLLAVLAAMVVVVVIIVALFASGRFESRADVNTLTLGSDGGVTFEEVGALDKEGYDAKELKDFIRTSIADYQAEHKGADIKLERYAAKGGTAYARIRYGDMATYSDFTGIEGFTGTVSEAKAAGYDMGASFIVPSDGEDAEPESVAAEDVTEDPDAKILILRENAVVKVDGTIRYVSEEGTAVSGKDTVTITPVDENEDAAVLTYIIYE